MKKLLAENEDLVKGARMLRAHCTEVARQTVVEGESIKSREEENSQTLQSLRDHLISEDNLKRALHQAQEELQGHKGALEKSIHDFRRLQELLHARTSQLVVAQSFMSQTDITSVAEVTRMVEALNHDIIQMAAAFADAPTIQLSEQVHTADSSQGLFISQIVIGDFLTNALTNSKPFSCRSNNASSKLLSNFTLEPDAMVQISIQACMTWLCNRIISSWGPDNSQNLVLKRIYSSLSHKTAGKS